MRVRPLYGEGKIKIKEKGKKPIYFLFPPIDSLRESSLNLMRRICKCLFEDVKYVNVKPDVYLYLPPVPIEEKISPEVLGYLIKKDEILRNVCIKALKPKDWIEKYPTLRRADFWVLIFYRGKTWITPSVHWKKREDLGEEIKEVAKRLCRLLTQVYEEVWYAKLLNSLNDETLTKIVEKYFPSKKELEVRAERKLEITPTHLKKKTEEIPKLVPRKEVLKKEVVEVERKKEIPYEDLREKVESFLNQKSSNFFDMAVKTRLESIGIEKMDGRKKKELYKIIYQYISSSKKQEAIKTFMNSLYEILNEI